MTDAFALLGLPRRPFLEEESIRSAYLERAKHLHPDSAEGHAESFSEAKNAFEILKDPATRLRHLIELETGQRPKQEAPSVAGALFSEVCATTELSRAVLAKAAVSKSPLVRALLLGDLRRAVAQTESVLQSVSHHQHHQTGELARLDAAWPEFQGAEAVAANLAFLAKCHHQLEECLFELTQTLRTFQPSGLSVPARMNKEPS
ncbi:MAG: J domain-containing protein [Terrimicrobiaceae bacterium]